MRVDGRGKPLRFRLTAGPKHDLTQVEPWLAGGWGVYVSADKGYEAQGFLLHY